MDVRRATPEDATAISEVAARSMRTAYEELVSDETIYQRPREPGYAEAVERWLRSTVASRSAVDLVATDGADDAVGFLQLLDGKLAPEELDRTAGYLESLYVLPDRWGEGIGTSLLERGLDASDATAVYLDVLRANDRAKGFYENNGFERVGRGTSEFGDATYQTDRYRRMR